MCKPQKTNEVTFLNPGYFKRPFKSLKFEVWLIKDLFDWLKLFSMCLLYWNLLSGIGAT